MRAGGDREIPNNRTSDTTFVLDADGTLFDLCDSIGSIYARVAQVHGLHLDPQKIDGAVRAIWSGFQDEYLNAHHGYATSPERERAVWGAFIHRVFGQCTEARISAALEEDVYSAFADPTIRSLAAGAEAFLTRASTAGVGVVVATNNDIRTRVCLSGMEIYPRLVAEVFLAQDIGWKKPSAKFFKGIADTLGIPTGSIIHVGNDRKLDVDAAIESGCRAVLYDPHSRHPSFPGPVVRSFEELLLP